MSGVFISSIPMEFDYYDHNDDDVPEWNMPPPGDHIWTFCDTAPDVRIDTDGRAVYGEEVFYQSRSKGAHKTFNNHQ